LHRGGARSPSVRVDQEFGADGAEADDDDEQSGDEAVGGAARREDVASIIGKTGTEHF
jgi:hypothetical protein